MSEFRVEKGRATVTLTLSNGATVRGSMFLWQGVAQHAGPERVRDLLNAEPGFFPFEVQTAEGARTFLYNREHVIYVTLDGTTELESDPGYDVATVRPAALLLSNGMRMAGIVRVYSPQGHDRLSDFARAHDRFQYLEQPGTTQIINVQHLIELTETFDS